MVILGVVLAALTQLFVSASKAQADMSNRFEAQQNARLALDGLRREIHCASAVPGTPTTSSLTITLPSYCPTNGTPADRSITWCTVGAAAPYALWRYESTSCSGTGRKWADNLVTGAVFSPVYTAPVAGREPRDGQRRLAGRPHAERHEAAIPAPGRDRPEKHTTSVMKLRGNKKLSRLAASEGGFGLIELLIAMTVMVIAIMAIVAGFSSGMVALNRASHASTAATLADIQMEGYRKVKYTDPLLTPTLRFGHVGLDRLLRERDEDRA